MNCIFLDLEWNQPCGRANMVSEPVLLHGEIIRIGAVRLTEDGELSDHYHICVIPEYYKKMNSSVERVTGLGNSSIAYGSRFPAAYGRLEQWWGEDAVIFTWGGEDEKILEANLAVHGMDGRSHPKFYDLQRVYSLKIIGDGRQHSLCSALEYYGIEMKLRPHDALNDAVYTAMVAQKMGFLKYLDEYDEMLRTAEERKKEKYYRTYQNLPCPEAVLRSRRVTACRCPICNRLMKRTRWVSRAENIIVSCAECEEHGEFFVRIKVKHCRNGTFAATGRFSRMTAEYREYYEKLYAQNIEPEKTVK